MDRLGALLVRPIMTDAPPCSDRIICAVFYMNDFWPKGLNMGRMDKTDTQKLRVE